MTLDAAVAPLPAPEGRWLHSARYDLTFLSGSLLIALLPLWLFDEGWLSRYGLTPFLVLLVMNLVLDYPHHMSTWTRAYMEPELRRRIGALAWLIPMGVTALTVGSDFYGRWDIPATILFILMIMHSVSQLNHICLQYRRADPDYPEILGWAEGAFLVSSPFFIYGAFLDRSMKALSSGWMGAAWNTLFAEPVVLFAGAVYLSAGLVIVVFALGRLRRGLPLPWPRLCFLATAALGYGVLVYIGNSTGNLKCTVEGYVWWHSAQMIYLTFLINRAKARQGLLTGGWLRSLVGQGKALRYWAFLMLPQFAFVYLGFGIVTWFGSFQAADGVWYKNVDMIFGMNHFIIDQFFFTTVVVLINRKAAQSVPAACAGNAPLPARAPQPQPS